MATKASRPTRTRYYMHTIDGKAATMSEADGQIVYADELPEPGGRPTHAVLRTSLRQIKRDQQTTRRNRALWKFKDSPGKYGYVLVDLP